VALTPMPSDVNANDTLIVRLVSYDLDLVVDMTISSLGLLEPDLFTHVVALDMCSFQSVSLPSSEDLLEAMTKFFPLTWCLSRALSSWNP
jgi:hypothetical protein